jgi:simple sugar transport system substrate-binding protein
MRPDTRTKRLTLRFITLCVDEDFFGPVKKGMRDACALVNAESTFVGTADIDIPAQVRMVESAVGDGVDGIALNLADAGAFNEAIRRAAAAGIPVIAFNIDASDGSAGNIGSVRQDLFQAGRMLGRKAAGSIPAGRSVLATVHSAGVSALEARLRGIRETIGTSIGKVLVTGMDPKGAAAKIQAELQADPSLGAVIGTGQADTEGAGLAAERLGKDTRPYVAGFDMSPEILRLVKEGSIAFTIDQQPYLQGFLPVIQLALNIRYGIRPAAVDAGAAIIESENVDAIMDLSRAGYR